MTTPFDYYQYWINTDDPDVRKFMRLYTFLPEEPIAELTTVEGEALREAKRVLAFETTRLTHGDEAARRHRRPRRDSSRAIGPALTWWPRGNSSVELPRSEVDGMSIADLFVRAGLSTSRSDARRSATQGGLSIGDTRLTRSTIRSRSMEPPFSCAPARSASSASCSPTDRSGAAPYTPERLIPRVRPGTKVGVSAGRG